jgi:phosphinothricin acetyltransferase
VAVPEAVIRPAASADLRAVAEIYAHYVSQTVITFDQVSPTVAEWQQRLDGLADRGLPFLVADVNGVVVGYAYAGPWRPKPAYRYTVEDSIYLAPDQTGRGLGGTLLGALLPRCAQAGMRQMIAVIADTGNGASAALHQRFGFAHAGRLTGVGHKHGHSIDTLLMQRALTTDEHQQTRERGQ